MRMQGNPSPSQAIQWDPMRGTWTPRAMKSATSSAVARFPSGENNAEQFVGEPFRITEVFDRELGRRGNGLGMRGGVVGPHSIGCLNISWGDRMRMHLHIVAGPERRLPAGVKFWRRGEWPPVTRRAIGAHARTKPLLASGRPLTVTSVSRCGSPVALAGQGCGQAGSRDPWCQLAGCRKRGRGRGRGSRERPASPEPGFGLGSPACDARGGSTAPPMP